MLCYVIFLVMNCALFTQICACLSAKSDLQLVVGIVGLVALVAADIWFCSKEFKRTQKEVMKELDSLNKKESTEDTKEN